MTERARKLQRLLAVRELQADLAAAELRVLRDGERVLRTDLAGWHRRMQVDAHSAMQADGNLMLACAEQEIAAMRAAEVAQAIEQGAAAIEAQAVEERERRIAREQMQRLCDRTGALARTVEERAVQVTLDDIFSAARLRRIAVAAERESSRPE